MLCSLKAFFFFLKLAKSLLCAKQTLYLMILVWLCLLYWMLEIWRKKMYKYISCWSPVGYTLIYYLLSRICLKSAIKVVLFKLEGHGWRPARNFGCSLNPLKFQWINILASCVEVFSHRGALIFIENITCVLPVYNKLHGYFSNYIFHF